MMKNKQQLAFAARLTAYTPIKWEHIPDLGLYMDQVITFVERQCKALYVEDERILTPAMVNNYVKMGLVSRPNGKKYAQEHLAQLLMICVLKQTASAEGMKKLLAPPEGEDIQVHYEHFCQTQVAVFNSLLSELPLESPTTCAVRGAAYRFLCNSILFSTPTEEE